ncbi:hypothetical protein Fleli_0335 [Bernardetia litoralis DSM 6794]|uniref:Uncharacterized protein n=1 Tax=Bernardetia litoralis (strain ATCC 23117 / DSM 6794 / NBRC 15988 / NCIMB 1366 / Fx l1 / Sio-4) TaxID=880071 RepID=I4AFT4_BERLS|nr:hypothetical protein [Bernardetia litoralis]AFM02819.1 hypothetical protein Fleli_0335 [Bernardetia litoralis DSM 6794]
MSFSYYDGGKEIHNVSPAAARYLSAQLKVEVGLLKNGKHYVLSIGTPSAINYAPAKGVELIYHTHPNGTIYPSIFDIGWLNKNNAYNATNASSIILPLGKPAIKFNTKTTYAAPPPPLQIEE